MNALTPPPRAPRRDEDAPAEPRLIAVAAEGWMGLPAPLALERLLDRLEAAPGPASGRDGSAERRLR